MKGIMRYQFILNSIGLLLLSMSTVFAANLPNQATIHFTIDSVMEGETCPLWLINTPLEIDYEYDFSKNWGWAHALKIQTTSLNQPLYPLGLSSRYAFMSDMAPLTVPVEAKELVLYRIVFNLYHNGNSQALLMLGQEGECIMSTNVVKVN